MRSPNSCSRQPAFCCARLEYRPSFVAFHRVFEFGIKGKLTKHISYRMYFNIWCLHSYLNPGLFHSSVIGIFRATFFPVSKQCFVRNHSNVNVVCLQVQLQVHSSQTQFHIKFARRLVFKQRHKVTPPPPPLRPPPPATQTLLGLVTRSSPRVTSPKRPPSDGEPSGNFVQNLSYPSRHRHPVNSSWLSDTLHRIFKSHNNRSLSKAKICPFQLLITPKRPASSSKSVKALDQNEHPEIFPLIEDWGPVYTRRKQWLFSIFQYSAWQWGLEDSNNGNWCHFYSFSFIVPSL